MTGVTPLSMPDPGATRSLWLQEALAHDPGDACPPLTGRVSADVCIVGGGFAGLWTAVELSERESDLRIAVVEQDICGGGASGRNGGFFSSSWWDAPATCALFGDDEGMRYLHAVADTVAEAGAWLETNDVDAWFHHEGTMRVATGAWAAGWRGFRRSFGVIADHVVATEPIPDRLEEIGWTSHVGIGDGRELVYYLRPTDDGRIVIGGGALGVVFGGMAGGRAASRDRRVAEAAARGLLWLFPQLEGVRFTHAWGGPIDQTATFLPFFRTLEPGNVHAGLGFSGHGLSQTMLGGRILASLVQGLDDEWTSMPVVSDEAKSPPEPLRYPLVWLSSRSLEAGDRRADAGRSRGVLLDAAGYAPSRYREHIATRAARRRG